MKTLGFLIIFFIGFLLAFSSSQIFAQPAPAPGDICPLPPPMGVDACQLQGISDPNPNDTICCSPIRTELRAVDHIQNVDYLPCGVERTCTSFLQPPRACVFDSDCNLPYPSGAVCIANRCCVSWRDPCYDTRSATVNRQIGITLLHPYLEQLWQLTTSIPAGFFNILRPNLRPRFADIQGKSQIFYSASSLSIYPSIYPLGIYPATGDFFFPHLGGIQKAKEETVRTVTPQGGR